MTTGRSEGLDSRYRTFDAARGESLRFHESPQLAQPASTVDDEDSGITPLAFQGRQDSVDRRLGHRHDSGLVETVLRRRHPAGDDDSVTQVVANGEGREDRLAVQVEVEIDDGELIAVADDQYVFPKARPDLEVAVTGDQGGDAELLERIEETLELELLLPTSELHQIAASQRETRGSNLRRQALE